MRRVIELTMSTIHFYRSYVLFIINILKRVTFPIHTINMFVAFQGLHQDYMFDTIKESLYEL